MTDQKIKTPEDKFVDLWVKDIWVLEPDMKRVLDREDGTPVVDLLRATFKNLVEAPSVVTDAAQQLYFYYIGDTLVEGDKVTKIQEAQKQIEKLVKEAKPKKETKSNKKLDQEAK